LIRADPREVIFTSGATESNNLAIEGAANFYRQSGKTHIITLKTEHKAVLDTCKHLEDEGFTVDFLPVSSKGLIDVNELASAITDQTCVVSVMAVNNEIGVVQPIKEIGAVTRARKVLFHTDCAQATGKIPLDVNE
jgi:cysteine desulfurase